MSLFFKINVFKLLFLLLIVTCACNTKRTSNYDVLDRDTSFIHFAENLVVKTYGDCHLVEVKNPWLGATQTYRYMLVPHGSSIPEVNKNTLIIRIPVKRLTCMATSHIAALEQLDALEYLVGFPNTDLISSPKTRNYIEDNKVIDLGKGKTMSTEKLLASTSDLIIAFGMNADDRQLTLLKRAGVPYILYADYMEYTPLGRAEWIKLMGLLCGKSEESITFFDTVTKNYNSLKKSFNTTKNKPTVFSGIIYGDTWFMPGGSSWSAQFFKDAGGNFFWKNEKTTGSLRLSPEEVLVKAKKADYWINVASFNSLNQLASTHTIYTEFEAFKKQNVFTYNARIGPKGGNDYLETGYIRPDLVLQDIINILHPNQLDQQQLYFYKRLTK